MTPPRSAGPTIWVRRLHARRAMAGVATSNSMMITRRLRGTSGVRVPLIKTNLGRRPPRLLAGCSPAEPRGTPRWLGPSSNLFVSADTALGRPAGRGNKHYGNNQLVYHPNSGFYN